MFAGDFPHRLLEAAAAQSPPRPSSPPPAPFFPPPEFAFGVDDLGPPLALRFGLLRHGAVHGTGQRHVLHLDRGDFDSPGFGLPVDDLLQLQADRLALRKQVVQRGLAEHAAQVVWEISEVVLRKFSTFTTAAAGSTTRK